MKNIFIYCAGGQGRQIAFLIEQIGGYNLVGFIDENPSKKDTSIKNCPVFNSAEKAFFGRKDIHVAIANGIPEQVRKITKKLKEISIKTNIFLIFPNLIHPSVLYDKKSVTFGEGNIINVGTNFTTDISIGNFNYFNRYCVLGHDTIIRNYCNFMAGVIVGGNVKINDLTYLGMGSRIIQDVSIGKNSFLSAGAVIRENVPENALMVGPQARLFKYRKPID